jgi:hypothetical protein
MNFTKKKKAAIDKIAASLLNLHIAKEYAFNLRLRGYFFSSNKTSAMANKKQVSENVIIAMGLELKIGALTNLAAALMIKEITPIPTISLAKFFISPYPLSVVFGI